VTQQVEFGVLAYSAHTAIVSTFVHYEPMALCKYFYFTIVTLYIVIFV